MSPSIACKILREDLRAVQVLHKADKLKQYETGLCQKDNTNDETWIFQYEPETKKN